MTLPEHDEALVQRLADLAGTIDGGDEDADRALVDEFNRLAGTKIPFSEFQGLAYRSRWRRFAIPFALVFVVLTGAAFFYPTSYRPIVGGLFVVALLNLVDAATHRLRWIRKGLASVAVDKSAEFTFTDEHIRISTPNSDGTLKYAAFGCVSVTPDGIFLVPDSGVSVFVPRSAFADAEEFSLVTSKLAEHVAHNET
jgi:hypothetical protein